MQNKLVVIAISIFFPFSVFAENTTTLDPSSKIAHSYYSYTVNLDGTNTGDIDYAITLLKEDALENTKQQAISYSTSVEKVDVLEAYTKKTNGKRIDVPKNNFQLEVNSGKNKDSPAFSDRTTLTIIFPDLEVGDTAVWHYKITQTEPLFPNHFSEMQTFYKSVIYDDVRVKIDMPDSMPVKYETSGLTEKKVVEKNGRKLYEWTFSNKKAVENKDDWGDVYQFGKNPGYMISTFPSYAAISAAYGVRAKQQAAVTGRIQKLADEITKGKIKPYEQAKALYEWVASNISYAGNCIGVGTVVPRNTDFVLDNHMGDCKDHATLLEALLNAKQIASTQALINTGSLYSLPKIPVVSMVNHVMNYIPSLNIYTDATSEDTPFGLLPDGEAGKPILLVDGYQEGLKTPPILHDSDKTTTNIKITIGEDGSAKGVIQWVLKGRSGLFANTDKRIKKYHEFKNSKEKIEEYSKSMVKKQGFQVGKVNYNFDEHPKSADQSTSEITFDVKEFINAGSLGAFNISSIFSSSYIYSSVKSSKVTDEPSSDFNCKGGHFEEHYSYEFPKNLKIMAVPDNVSFNNALVSYQASFKLIGNTLTVTRKYDDTTLGPVCEPKIYKAYKELAEKAMPNLKSQIVYKYI
jgi:transglutaminase-like putative cysteine protease